MWTEQSDNIKIAQALETGRPGLKFCTCHLWVGKDKLLNFYELQCHFHTMVISYDCYEDQ